MLAVPGWFDRQSVPKAAVVVSALNRIARASPRLPFPKSRIGGSKTAVARMEPTISTWIAGGPALVRSVFETLPGEGRWDTVLLMDGNIGIGGDPAALLGRRLVNM